MMQARAIGALGALGIRSARSEVAGPRANVPLAALGETHVKRVIPDPVDAAGRVAENVAQPELVQDRREHLAQPLRMIRREPAPAREVRQLVEQWILPALPERLFRW